MRDHLACPGLRTYTPPVRDDVEREKPIDGPESQPDECSESRRASAHLNQWVAYDEEPPARLFQNPTIWKLMTPATITLELIEEALNRSRVYGLEPKEIHVNPESMVEFPGEGESPVQGLFVKHASVRYGGLPIVRNVNVPIGKVSPR